VESSVYPLSMLLLDYLFFLLCALHPTTQGLWLSTVEIAKPASPPFYAKVSEGFYEGRYHGRPQSPISGYVCR